VKIYELFSSLRDSLNFSLFFATGKNQSNVGLSTGESFFALYLFYFPPQADSLLLL